MEAQLTPGFLAFIELVQNSESLTISILVFISTLFTVCQNVGFP